MTRLTHLEPLEWLPRALPLMHRPLPPCELQHHLLGVRVRVRARVRVRIRVS